MDENPLSNQQQTQADLVSQAYLQDTTREQQRRLEKLEVMYAVAHNGLVSFLTLLDPDFIDTCLKQGQIIQKLDDRIMQQRVILAIKALQEKVSSGANRQQHGLVDAIDENGPLKEENQRLLEQLGQTQAEIHHLKQTNERLLSQSTVSLQVIQKAQAMEKQNITLAEQIISPIQQGVPEPEWMVHWRETKTFLRDSVFLCLIGETGLSRQPSIKKLAAAKLDLRLDNGSLSKPLERLSDPDGPKLIEYIDDFEKSGSDAGGAMPKFYRLTDLGRQAYWMLTGQNPVECEYDRLKKLHKTPEHTFLNLRAMDVLEEVGDYSILVQNPVLEMPDGSQFIPDVVARKNDTDDTIYIEVERGAGKDTAYRAQKWNNLCTASVGKIYVICDTKHTVKAVLSEINSALSGRAYHSFLTDLEELQDKKRGKDGSMWIYQR